MSEQRRRHFRLRYPIPIRPPIEIDGNVFSVVDVSEGGLRLHGVSSAYPEEGKQVTGEIEFQDGAKVEIIGHVLRTTDQGDCVLELERGVPQSRMMDEQRRMIQKHRV